MIPSTRNRNKNLLMVNGFTFSQYFPTFWYCTKKKRGCPAKARTDTDGHFLKSLSEEHNHEPPRYHLTETVRWAKRENGKLIALINGYSFYCDGRNRSTDIWTCPRSHCRARFVITKNRQYVKSYHLEHNHSPSKYMLRNELPLPRATISTVDPLSMLKNLKFEDNEVFPNKISSNISIVPANLFELPSASTCTNSQSEMSPSIIKNSSHTWSMQVPELNIEAVTLIPSPANSLSGASMDVNTIESVSSPVNLPYAEDISAFRTHSQKRKGYKSHSNIKQGKDKDQQRKYNINRGLPYMSRSGKLKPRKHIKPPCPQSCRQKCYEKITEENRQKLFDLFWSIGDHTRQWVFITKYVKKIPKRCITADNSKRIYTFKYSLPKFVSNEDNNVEEIQVCKLMFLRTFSIGISSVYTALEKLDSNTGVLEADRRGKHLNHPKIMTPDMIRSVMDHVEAFSSMQAKNTCKVSNRTYFEGTLSYPKMFHHYKNWFDPIAYSAQASNVRQYRDIVNKKFNSRFFSPLKD